MNKKISELNEATQISDNDILMILQNNENKRVNISKIKTVKRESIILETIVSSNTNYTIPLSYKVNNNSLEIYYCGEKLTKGQDYIEVGENGAISNTIQFTNTIGDLDMTGVEGFEDFNETLEFVVRGDYSDT